MRSWLVTTLLACPLFGAAATPSAQAPGTPRRFRIDLVVRQGDPLGDREADDGSWLRPATWEPGPALILARTSLIARAGEKVSFRCHDKDEPKEEWADGNRLKLGYGIRLTPTQLPDQKIRLDVTMSHTEVFTRMEGRLLVQSGENTYRRSVRLGEPCRLRWGSGHKATQTWVELTVRGMEP